MSKSIGAAECKDNWRIIYNDAIRKEARKLIPEGKEGWCAEYVLHIPKETLSVYLNGSRSFPAWLVILMDTAFKTPALLEVIAGAEQRSTVSNTPSRMAALEIEKLYPVILRKQGHANGDIVAALMDHEIDTEEQEHIHAHAVEMRRFWQDMEERTANIPKVGVA
jgi:hypothetical protein